MVKQIRRYALFQATPDSEFVKETYGGYFNVFVSAFGDEGDQWDLFRVIDGEFPTDDDLEEYDGFVISGSLHDAFTEEDWINELCSVCKKLDVMKKKILGICFGHQIICRVRGGKVGRARKGPDIGLGNITIVQDLIEPGGYFGEEVPESLSIIECHRDEVLDPPESAKVIGFSDKCDVEIFSVEDHLLCFQGHPEYNKEILLEIIDRCHKIKFIEKQNLTLGVCDRVRVCSPNYTFSFLRISLFLLYPSVTFEKKMVVVEQKKRFALFLATCDSEFVKKTYGGYFNVFVSTFSDEGEQWDLFRVIDGEFPDDKDLHKYDGFVISGSPHDAFGDADWILKLCDVVHKLDEMKKKVLGICFGHQIITRVKGGKIGRARQGADMGLRSITIAKDNEKLRRYFGDEVPASLAIIKCHQDEVLELPESATVLASSEVCEVEMFSIGDQFLCIQGHPEYNKEILFEIVDRVLNMKLMTQEFADKAKSTMETAQPDRNQWQKLCKNFLKGRSEQV